MSFPDSHEGMLLDRDEPASVMNEVEAEEYVKRLLLVRGPMTTHEIEAMAAGAGRRCPDQTVLFLVKLKQRGIIDGEVSMERRGWVWWLPGD